MSDNIKHLAKEIQKWSSVYNFSFQFWGEGNNNVFIAKDNIDLASFGGEDTIQAIFDRTMQWVKEKNPNGLLKEEKRTYAAQRCNGCGSRVANGNDYCAECLCEDDGYI